MSELDLNLNLDLDLDQLEQVSGIVETLYRTNRR